MRMIYHGSIIRLIPAILTIMDLVLNLLDNAFLTDYVYPSSLPEDNPIRQTITLMAVFTIGGLFMYLSVACLSYFFLFDHKLKQHPLYIKDQVKLEIKYACSSIPFMSLLTVPIMLAEVRGYSKLYMGIEGLSGWAFIGLTVIAFLMFTDCLIYWIHRMLHYPLIYRNIHKGHHKWKVPTPFASHAFHPIDGWVQSLPYHIYPFFFPLHKVLYLLLFVFVNIWTISIHDANYRVPALLKPFINGSAHHTDHHLFYLYNYGQFFTLWDRIGGSFRYPSAFEGNSVLKDVADKVTANSCKKLN